jgi:hypothetical protein
MNRDEIRKILSAYQSGDEDAMLFAEAKQAAQKDPELAKWFAEEQEFDLAVTEGIGATTVPAGLKTRILAKGPATRIHERLWPRRIALAAAAIIVFAVFFSSWRGLFVPNVSLADYRSEMVSFIKITPPLELESTSLDRIRDWLGQRDAPIASAIPSGLSALDPVGCRILTFRGHEVTLICFRRGPGKLVHLFVVDRGALSKLPNATAPVFAQEQEWMTAAWQDTNHAYLMGTQGDRALLERYLNRS